MRKVVVVRRSRIHKEAALILSLIKLYGSIFSSSASEMNVFATASFHHDNLFSLISDGTDTALNRGKGGIVSSFSDSRFQVLEISTFWSFDVQTCFRRREEKRFTDKQKRFRLSWRIPTQNKSREM